MALRDIRKGGFTESANCSKWKYYAVFYQKKRNRHLNHLRTELKTSFSRKRLTEEQIDRYLTEYHMFLWDEFWRSKQKDLAWRRRAKRKYKAKQRRLREQERKKHKD